jgi:hypothetical protein
MKYETRRIDGGYAVIDTKTGRRVTQVFRDVKDKHGAWTMPWARMRCRRIAARWNARAA